MPALTYQTLDKTAQTPLTFATLDGTDTFTYQPTESVMILENPTGGDITFTMIGDGAPATKFLSGVGVVTVDPISVTVTAGAYRMVPLRFYDDGLKGAVTITTGNGMNVALVEY